MRVVLFTLFVLLIGCGGASHETHTTLLATLQQGGQIGRASCRERV